MSTGSNKNTKNTRSQIESVKQQTPAGKVTFANPDLLKSEALVWLLSICTSLLIYLVVAYIIHNNYHPNIDAQKEQAKDLLIQWGGVRPEPVEALLTRVGVFVIGLSLMACYYFFSKMARIKELAQSQLFSIISFTVFAGIIGLIYYDFAALNPFGKDNGDTIQNNRDYVTKTNFDFFFDGLFVGNNVLLYSFILVPLISLIFFFGIRKFNWERNKTFNRLMSGAGYLFGGGIVLAIVAMTMFLFPYTFENKYDFNAVYYSVTQVHAGMPMLVDGFTNTYGLYPHFLNLIFSITGLSVLKFSMVMSLLTGTCFAFNFYVLREFTSNKLILLLGFLTVIFFPYLDSKLISDFDPYFAIFPIRYLIPSTLAFLVVRYLKSGSKITYWLTTVLMSCFILWNPETGLIGMLSWLAFNCYNDFYSADGKIAFVKIGFHLAACIGMAVVVAYVYEGLIFAVYGAAPDLSLLFGTILVFGKIGFYLLPMAVVHPWNLMVIVLCLGFVYAISKLFNKERTPKASFVFLISVISLGFYFYFQGRSHNMSFSSIAGFSIMLLIIMGDSLWENIKDKNVPALDFLFAIFLFSVSFSFFEILSNVPQIREMVSQEENISKQADDQKRTESNIEFIKKNTKEHEKIFMFSAIHYQGLYFDGTKRVSAFNPGIMDMFMNTDLDKMSKKITESDTKVFIEPEEMKFFYMEKPYAAVAASYEAAAFNNNMAMLVKRKTKVPAKTFFDKREGLLIDRKYTDEPAGILARQKDDTGVVLLNNGTSFSFEALFFTKEQLFPFGTVMGNMDDTSGFIIANMVHTPNYFFGINGKGVGVSVPKDAWVYCAVNVLPDHAEVYVNGSLAGNVPLARPYVLSPRKFCVGNLGFMRYFVGAIAEVAVHSKPLDKSAIAATWQEIAGM